MIAPVRIGIDRNALFDRGYAVVRSLFDADTCVAIRARYGWDEAFRSTVVMQRHGFGRGEYRYFSYPLPPDLAGLRENLYAELAPIANDWQAALGSPRRFPASLPLMLDECAAAGQNRPTVLMLRYGPGDHNALHQDRYGEVVFPFQATLLLSDPNHEFSGGEFVLVENRPRKQSLAHVVSLRQGDLIVFPSVARPAQAGGTRTTMRHGVSEVLHGERFALGLIFHDAP